MLQEEKIRSLDVVQVGQRIREVRKSQGYKSVDIAAQLYIISLNIFKFLWITCFLGKRQRTIYGSWMKFW